MPGAPLGEAGANGPPALPAHQASVPPSAVRRTPGRSRALAPKTRRRLKAIRNNPGQGGLARSQRQSKRAPRRLWQRPRPRATRSAVDRLLGGPQGRSTHRLAPGRLPRLQQTAASSLDPNPSPAPAPTARSRWRPPQARCLVSEAGATRQTLFPRRLPRSSLPSRRLLLRAEGICPVEAARDGPGRRATPSVLSPSPRCGCRR